MIVFSKHGILYGNKKPNYEASEINNCEIKGTALSLINQLNYNDTQETGKFVCSVSETNGKIKVTKDTLPTRESLKINNVDNTSDINKPVSTKQQTAIDNSYNNSIKYIDNKVSELTTKIDSINTSSGGDLHFIDVTDYDINPDFTDVTDKINNLIKTVPENSTLFFPEGSYRVTNSINLKSNLTLFGHNAHFVGLKDDGGDLFFASNYPEDTFLSAGDTPENLTNITIKGFIYTSNNDDKAMIRMRQVDNILIEDCESSCCLALIHEAFNINSGDGTSNPNVTAGMDDISKVNHNIIIKNCKGKRAWTTSSNPDTLGRGIFIAYAQDVRISDCTFEGYSQGIQLWGGDADMSRGGTNTTKFCENITVSNCTVRNVSGGGIWGSMVKNMLIDHCTVENCMDVGLDFEGCTFCRAYDCYVSNCRFGNLAIYSMCLDCEFGNIMSVQDDSNNYSNHFMSSNAKQNPMEINITLKDCSFISKNSIGQVTFASCKQRNVKDCYFENCKLTYNDGCVGFINSNIIDNKFIFTKQESNLPVITVKSYNYKGVNVVDGNIIDFREPTWESGIGILCLHAGSQDTNHIVTNNTIIGNCHGIKCKNTVSKNMYVAARDNTCKDITTEGTVKLYTMHNFDWTNTLLS